MFMVIFILSISFSRGADVVSSKNLSLKKPPRDRQSTLNQKYAGIESLIEKGFKKEIIKQINELKSV